VRSAPGVPFDLLQDFCGIVQGFYPPNLC
jgi:hypothetical protein